MSAPRRSRRTRPTPVYPCETPPTGRTLSFVDDLIRLGKDTRSVVVPDPSGSRCRVEVSPGNLHKCLGDEGSSPWVHIKVGSEKRVRAEETPHRDPPQTRRLVPGLNEQRCEELRRGGDGGRTEESSPPTTST